MTAKPYFTDFEHRQPSARGPLGRMRTVVWQFLAGATIGFSAWYLFWRWTSSLNPDALVFSCVVAMAETLFFLGTILFFYDIWCEGDTKPKPPPTKRSDVGCDSSLGSIGIDVYITTYDEDLNVVVPSILAAKSLRAPPGTSVNIWLLDDGNRSEFSAMAALQNVGYLSREDNLGFKAGNLKNALLQTQGDFILICDADTRVFPCFLENTLGYFRDSHVAWVQTPHWFYDLPFGVPWAEKVQNRSNRILPTGLGLFLSKLLGPLLRGFSGRDNSGQDPFMSEPVLFFDVIQRRRNRHGASFCCGAGSIHRREALFQGAMRQMNRQINATAGKFNLRKMLSATRLQPFKFHVSEDIYTSITLHSDSAKKWRSVYHPQVESRMLSPWSVDAWATQKLKYAGGTFDIMLHDNPIFRRGMPWRIKLHYAATFWSYLSVLWTPIMMLAPALSLVTGWKPVEAYTVEFFARILPVLIIGELAMIVGCKGYNVNIGRVMAIGGLPITLRAFWYVLRGKKPKFPATPKTPIFGESGFKYALPNIILLGGMGAAGLYGCIAALLHVPGFSATFLTVNLFWLTWNAVSLMRVVRLTSWRPPPSGLLEAHVSPSLISPHSKGLSNAAV